MKKRKECFVTLWFCVFFLHSATCSTASLAPSRGLSGSTFTSAVWVNTCSSDTLEQAVNAPWVRGKEEKGPTTAVIQLKTLTSRVAKRACCCGLSGLTLTVWLDLNSWRFASLSHAWTAPWPVITQQMRHKDSGKKAAVDSVFKEEKSCFANERLLSSL